MNDLAGGESKLAQRIVTTSPDVTVSTNLGAWVNRQPGIVINVQRQPGANVIAVVDNIQKLLPDLQAQRISRNGQVCDAPLEAWVWAIEQALAARDAGRLTLPLKSHGWLYEVISNWRPQAGQVVAAGEQRQALAKTPSKTLSAIAALEDRARG